MNASFECCSRMQLRRLGECRAIIKKGKMTSGVRFKGAELWYMEEVSANSLPYEDITYCTGCQRTHRIVPGRGGEL